MATDLNDTDNRCVAPSTVGYLCLALALWMTSMVKAAWYDRIYAHGSASLFPWPSYSG